MKLSFSKLKLQISNFKSGLTPKISSRKQKGQSLIELLVTIGLMAVILPALIVGFVATRSGRAQQEQRLKATALLQEGEEAVRVVRETDWATFAALSSPSGTQYKLTHVPSTTWSLAQGTETTADGITRYITISDVYRDFVTDPTNAPIVDSTAPNATLDPSTKKVTVTVHWNNPLSTTESATEYLTRDESLMYTETTQAQFNAGTLSNVTTTANNPDGEVLLGAGGTGGDWCQPSLSLTSVDLSRQGIPTSITAYEGNVFTGTGGNASGPTFVQTTMTGDPPTAKFQGQYNNAKANGIFAEPNYGYIATSDNSQEIKILDLNNISNSNFAEVGWFDAPGKGGSRGDTVYVLSDIGYMTDGTNFYTFDLRTASGGRSGSRPQLNTSSSVTLDGNGKKLIVIQDTTDNKTYAYVATDSTSKQLDIIDVTDPVHPSKIGTASTGNNKAGTGVAINATDTRAYVITQYASSSTPDFYIFNISTKSGSHTPLAHTYNTNGMSPTGIAVPVTDRVILVGSGGTYQYQVFSLVNDTPGTCPTGTGTLAIANGAYDVASVMQHNNYAYSYVVTGDTNHELKIVMGGGSGGGSYAATGIYTSKIIDLGNLAGTNKDVALNSFYVDNTVLSGTTLQYYIGLKHGPCSSATFSFPTDFSGPYSLSTGVVQALPLNPSGTGYVNPGQCLQYKAYFTASSDQTLTPILNSITFSFSP